jgi:peptidoglycan-associated lipoprotein
MSKLMLIRRFLKMAALLGVAAVVSTGCRGCANNPFLNKLTGGQNAPGALGGPGGVESSALPEPIRGQTPQPSSDLRTIYFEFDSASLLEQAKVDLASNAQYLRSNPLLHIQIEGHCDIQGTPEYNYALGQRRAEAARNHLITEGIDSSRIHTISYGSERPAVEGSDDLAYAKNRRAEFLVYTK